ncbi:MAG: hypothetical protein U0263_38390 [Polyangiaceae bacterium]
MCWLDTTGAAACVKIADAGVATMDGKICGNTTAQGATACMNTCLNGACVAITAKTGTACRTTLGFNNGPCSGACNAAGQCMGVPNPCQVNRVGCIVNACNMNNSAQCTSVNLLKGTTCTDNNACTLGDACDGVGKCAAGAPKNCDDNNVCTTDTCNPNNGACIGQPNTNACDDGNACTENDKCAAAVCGAGTPKNCDDANACTTDSCNPASGCVHTAKSCDDNDACTTDTCDATSGNCGHAAVSCDDNNPCTTDSCAAATGCAHAPIANCGTGGTGGTGGATGGTGGATGGTGGATGGTGGGTGGAAGTAAGGAAGTAAGGAAGTAAGGAAGTAAGGAAGSAGTGTGGTSAGGTSAGGTSSGGSSTGGSSTGGIDGGAGTGGKKSSNDSGDGGCGCRVPAREAPRGAALLGARRARPRGIAPSPADLESFPRRRESVPGSRRVPFLLSARMMSPGNARDVDHACSGAGGPLACRLALLPRLSRLATGLRRIRGLEARAAPARGPRRAADDRARGTEPGHPGRHRELSRAGPRRP